jgi:hypothetical protein
MSVEIHEVKRDVENCGEGHETIFPAVISFAWMHTMGRWSSRLEIDGSSSCNELTVNSLSHEMQFMLRISVEWHLMRTSHPEC